MFTLGFLFCYRIHRFRNPVCYHWELLLLPEIKWCNDSGHRVSTKEAPQDVKCLNYIPRKYILHMASKPFFGLLEFGETERRHEQSLIGGLVISLWGHLNITYLGIQVIISSNFLHAGGVMH